MIMKRPTWFATKSWTTNSEEQDIGLLEVETKFTDAEDDQSRRELGFPPNEPEITRKPAKRNLLFKTLHYVSQTDYENLLPAWLRKRKERRLHPTSYLDGLRGVASFFVFIHHSSFAFFPEIRLGYGAAPTQTYPENYNHFIQLPIVRLIYSGSAMVDIFFVISGAVLTLKPLRLARDGQHLQLIENLSSSVFRRGPRLYIPCLVSTFVTAVVSMLGFMLQDGISRHYPLSPNHSWFEQLSVWFWDMLQFIRPWAIGTQFEQNLWTIPIEFRGSMMVFLCALGVAKLRSRWLRTLSLVVLNCYWTYLGWWEMFLFLSGMLISELSLYRREEPKHRVLTRVGHLVLAILAAYLISTPEMDENLGDSSYGYGWIWNNFSPGSWSRNVEPGRFWPCFGAVLFIAIQSHAGPNSWYQQFFTTRFIQYLGEISFSFYLWHGLIIYTVGARVMTLTLARFGSEGVGWWMSLAFTEIAMLPTLFWISDLSTVYVDKAVVKLGKALMEL